MDNFRDSYFQVDWDLTTKRLKGTFWGKQYDTGRGFAVTVINGGQVVTATNEVLRLKWEKPDNTTGYVNATIVNGKFIVENIDQMFTVNGSVRADFELSVAGESLASITFYVSVEKAVAVDAIESSSDFTALQDALADVGDMQAQVDAVIANATVDSEVILARGTEPTLGARLDSTDAQLAEIASGEGLNDKSVTPEKTTFVDVSPNLYNKETSNDYKKVTIESRVELVDSLDRTTSEFISVKGNATYSSNKIALLQAYTTDKVPIGSPRNFNPTTPVTTTSSTRFVRVVVHIDDKDEFMMVEGGDAPTKYEPYGALYIPNLSIDTGTDEEQVNQLIDDKISQYDIQIQQIIDNKISQIKVTKIPTSLLSFEEIPSSPAVYVQHFKSQETGKIYSRGVTGIYEWNSIENDEFRLCGVDKSSMTGAIEYMHVTSEFVVYVMRDTPTLSTFIYRADNVDVVNPTLVHSYVGGYPNSMHCASYHDGIIDVILVSTYNHIANPSSPLPLFVSTDRGMTWQKIHEAPVTDNTTNSRWHSVAYDPSDGIIWASNGDGANRGVNWSYDMGQTWNRIDGIDQPTMILPFEDRVIFGRDASSKKPGLDGYERKETAHEVELYDALTFRTDQPANWNYPQHNFWADTNIGYVLFSPTTAPLNDMQYIYATGDGGKSWHLVWSVHRDELRIERITGISEDGYVVATVLRHDTIPSNRLIKAKAVSWA